MPRHYRPGLDVVRLAALLPVLCYHYCIEAARLGFAVPTVLISRGMADWVELGLAWFFLLSGAALCLQWQGRFALRRYLAGRAAATYPAFWLGFAALFLYGEVLHGNNADIPRWRVIFSLLGLDGYLAGFRAEYAGAFRAGICSLSENPDCGAEAALYNARQGCAHAFRTETPCAFSTRGMIDESEQLERLRGSMSKAVEKGEFEPYLQFVVDRAGTVVGAETVSRWQNPEEGLLKPSKYIDLMIRAGTITELDLYMLRCACVQLQTWKREGRGTLWLSCNFTRQSIADEKILARVHEIVEQYDFTRDRLVVELTEDSYAHDRETALRTIEGLHAMGLRIVLDDIGAGYSSLSDLSTYPIDGVKIDRSIVIESALPRARALLEGMIRLSHDMGIRVLCEGVEDKATCDAVLAAGCDFIQGFYFSRVLPGREAESFLRSLAARDREEG